MDLTKLDLYFVLNDPDPVYDYLSLLGLSVELKNYRKISLNFSLCTK